MIARACKETNLDVMMAILDPMVQGTEQAQAVAIESMVDAVFDSILGKRTGGTVNAICMSIEQPMVVSQDHWRMYSLVSTFLRIRFSI